MGFLKSVDHNFVGSSFSFKKNIWLCLPYVIAIAIAVVVGALSAFQNTKVLLLFIGLIFAIILPLKLEFALWCLIFLSLIIVGSLEYFARIKGASWGLLLIALAIFARVLLEFCIDSKIRPRIGSSSVLFWLVVCIPIVFAISAVLNAAPGNQILSGIKKYVPFLGVFFLIALGFIRQKTLEKMFKCLILIACLQWLFTLYQWVVIVPIREKMGSGSGIPHDAIVGSFGGNMFGGGASGSMALFVLLCIALVIALWQHKQLSPGKFILAIVLLLAPLTMAEVKAFILFLPIVVVFLFRHLVFKNPAKFMGALMSLFVGLFAITLVYDALIWSKSDNYQGFFGHFSKVMMANFQENNEDILVDAWQSGDARLGRIEIMQYWIDHHTIKDPLHYLFGHGIGTSRLVEGALGSGEMATKHGIPLNGTASSQLLWDVGVLGLTIYTSLFIIAYFQSGRMSKIEDIPTYHRALLAGIQPILLVCIFTIPYKSLIVGDPGAQFTVMFLLGYVAYWRTVLGKQLTYAK